MFATMIYCTNIMWDMAVFMKISDICDIMSYCLDDRCYRFGVPYCLHLHDMEVRGAGRSDECYKEGERVPGLREKII